MEPNVNNVSNGTAGAGPVGTEQVVAEQVTVAQVEPVAAGSVVAEPEKSKKGHGMLIGLILCLLLAAGGIGFGVWEMMDGNTTKADFENQIADLKKQNNELRDKLSSTSEIEEDVTVNVETDDGVDVADYIYVGGEWNAKVKKPSSVVGFAYAFDGYKLYVWGTVHQDGDQAAGDGVLYGGSDGKIESPALARIELTHADSCPEGEKIGEFNGRNVCYYETGRDYLIRAYGSDLETYIEPTLKLLRDNFADLNNYSKN